MRVVAAVVVLLAASLLPGCTQPPAMSFSDTFGIRIIDASCPEPAAMPPGAWCRAEGGVVELGDVNLQHKATQRQIPLLATAGIEVSGKPPRQLRIANITLQDFPNGLRIDLPECACEVEIADIHILGNHSSFTEDWLDFPDYEYTGIAMTLPGKSHVRMDNVTVSGYPLAIFLAGPERPHEGGGFDFTTAASLDVDGLVLECLRTGMVVFSGDETRIRGAQVRGCQGIGIDARSPSSLLEVTDSVIERNGKGVRFWSSNWTSEEPTHVLRLVASTFIRNGLGVHIQLATLDVEGCTFGSNGGAGATRPPDDDRGGIQGGGFVNGQIHNSSFEGNEPFALAAGILAYTIDVDATENWWGSPLGPRPVVRGEGIGPGGDAVTVDGVRFVPFRTQP